MGVHSLQGQTQKVFMFLLNLEKDKKGMAKCHPFSSGFCARIVRDKHVQRNYNDNFNFSKLSCLSMVLN